MLDTASSDPGESYYKGHFVCQTMPIEGMPYIKTKCVLSMSCKQNLHENVALIVHVED